MDFWRKTQKTEAHSPHVSGTESARPDTSMLYIRHSGAYHVCIDEHGVVKLLKPGHNATVLEPVEAFDLLDFLFAYRALLAACSAEVAERLGETCT
jgi:hypothetical protein